MPTSRPRLFAHLFACLAAIAGAAWGASADNDLHARSLAATCANCHGTAGLSAGGLAGLGGRSRDEIVRAMSDFRSGARPSTVMQQLAKGYTDADVAAIAQWYAKQPKR